MLGVIAGDVIGSRFEWAPTKSTAFPLFHPLSHFTDDSVLTVATAAAILRRVRYDTAYLEFGRRHPRAGYGGTFYQWLHSADPVPYSSWGNGSAMRVAPVGWAFEDVERVLLEAERSAAVTHNHHEGVKGSQAVALAVFLARTGASKDEIRTRVTAHTGYDLDRRLDDIRPDYRFDVSCQGSVPEALIAFLESTDFEDAIRRAVSLGGDSDTLAAMAGGMAHAFYGDVPEHIAAPVRERLTEDLREVLEEFEERFVAPRRPSSASRPAG